MPIKERDNNPNNLHRGDAVIIINTGATYTTYVSWIVDNIHDVDKVARYCYNHDPKKGMLGRIMWIAPHGVCDDRLLAYVHTNDGYYLIGIEGLMKVENPNFFEIEDYVD